MRLILVSFTLITFMVNAQKTVTPVAQKINKEITTHQHTRIDPYYWMNERDSKEVVDYIHSENKISGEFYAKNKHIVQKLVKEFDQRINPNDVFPPFELNGKTFQTSYTEGDDYTKTHVFEKGKKTLFIDENKRAKKQSFYELADWDPSPNNELVALSEDFVGRRNYTISFRHFNSETFLNDQLKETDGTMEWANDSKTIYYLKKDPQTLRSYQLYKHILGQAQEQDELIFEEKDERYELGIDKSQNKRYILLYTASSTTTEVYLIDANNPSKQPQLFLPRENKHEYQVIPHNDGFYVLSNKNAENKQLLFSKTIPNSIEDCEVVIAHNKERLIQNVEITQTHLFLEERFNGLEQIRIYTIADKNSFYIEVPEETYMLSLVNNNNYYAQSVNYRYNSMTTPTTIYRFDLNTKQKELTFQYQLRDKEFSPDKYVSKRIWATANDGTKIPISIVYKKGTDLSKAPCLLYGYGSYGYTIPDVFSATRLSLLNRGFVYAIAHIRGENYLGEEWYQKGKLLAKKNTFTDFINAAEYLGMQHYCDPSKLYIEGGSAGGLLMGAVTNMSPYLFKGVIAEVPFVDVVTTMLDETIPLTVGEFEEWGNPKDEEYYYYMLSYSPYDNVRRMDYPHLLITTGYHDSQVQYWEPLKWIAKLRDYRTNDNLLLLDCNMDAGHGGGSGRSTERYEIAKAFAFILALEKLD